MYTLLESKDEIAQAQRKLEASFNRDFKRKVIKSIGYPGGTTSNAKVVSNGRYWFWSKDFDDLELQNPRKLNWFGIFHEDRDLQISVEINTPYQGINGQIAGYFARNNDTGSIYLFHSGRVGGGTTGVSKNAFLAWSDKKTEEVYDSEGNARSGILVMPVEGLAATRSAIVYVETIANFKVAVRAGETNKKDFKTKENELADFYAEARGRRKGKRAAEFDYISRHGEVVDALHSWRAAIGLAKGLRLVKNVLIDLGVASGKNLNEIYEVKTSAFRSDVYSAIGQLLVHGSKEDCKRVIVLPQNDKLANDLERALIRNSIEIVRYMLTEDSVLIK
jgi:hypothetical protein